MSRALRTLEQQGAITWRRNRVIAVNAAVLHALLGQVADNGYGP
ncbi:MAG TPA: hypothetical protein VNL35_08940 [Chloroflexota bacterium]|nr:hypothetical protein [Chloroflexota bacterium]